MTPEALAVSTALRGQPARYIQTENKRRFRRSSSRPTSVPATTAAKTPAPLQVMSFNIRNSNAMDGANAWPNRRELLFKTIETFNPDLLGLQEVLPLQRDNIIERFGKTYQFLGVGRNDGKEKGEYAAVLYRRDRFEKVADGRFWLSPTPDVPGSRGWDADLPRIVTWVQLRDHQSRNQELFFFNTHWDHKGVEARLQSASLMRDRIRQISRGAPVIVTGDFNADNNTPPYNHLLGFDQFERNDLPLTDTFRVIHPTPTREQFTPHPFTGKNEHPIRIDWILHSPQFRTFDANIDHTSDNGRYPSDHFPITATVLWRE